MEKITAHPSLRHLGLAALVAIAGLIPGTVLAQATVSVVHGVPDALVDVYVDGDQMLTRFNYTAISGGLQLDAGAHDIAVYAAGADPATESPLIELNGAVVQDGDDVSIVAHLTDGGGLALTPFLNEFNARRGRFASPRLEIRHVANAPPFIVSVNGREAFQLANGSSAGALARGRQISISLETAIDRLPTVGPFSPRLEPGANVLYLVGNLVDPNGDSGATVVDDPGTLVDTGTFLRGGLRGRGTSQVANGEPESPLGILMQVVPYDR